MQGSELKSQIRQRGYWILAALLLAGIGLTASSAFASLPAALPSSSANSLTAPGPQTPFDCSQIEKLGIDRQMNAHADQIMAQCGRSPKPQSANQAQRGPVQSLFKGLLQPLALGGADVDV